MEQSISATEARVHFGAWLRRVKDQNLTLIVEKAGRPEAVLLSVEAFGRLQAARRAEGAGDVLDRARALREAMCARRSGEPVSPPEDVIAEMRGERGDDLAPVR